MSTTLAETLTSATVLSRYDSRELQKALWMLCLSMLRNNQAIRNFADCTNIIVHNTQLMTCRQGYVEYIDINECDPVLETAYSIALTLQNKYLEGLTPPRSLTYRERSLVDSLAFDCCMEVFGFETNSNIIHDKMQRIFYVGASGPEEEPSHRSGHEPGGATEPMEGKVIGFRFVRRSCIYPRGLNRH
eukprot:464104-Hanusia_phi.AAC.4